MHCYQHTIPTLSSPVGPRHSHRRCQTGLYAPGAACRSPAHPRRAAACACGPDALHWGARTRFPSPLRQSSHSGPPQPMPLSRCRPRARLRLQSPSPRRCCALRRLAFERHATLPARPLPSRARSSAAPPVNSKEWSLVVEAYLRTWHCFRVNKVQRLTKLNKKRSWWLSVCSDIPVSGRGTYGRDSSSSRRQQ